MIDAYTIGITLALNDGVSTGIASIRRELGMLGLAIAGSAAGLRTLHRLGQQLAVPAPTGMRREMPEGANPLRNARRRTVEQAAALEQGSKPTGGFQVEGQVIGLNVVPSRVAAPESTPGGSFAPALTPAAGDPVEVPAAAAVDRVPVAPIAGRVPDSVAQRQETQLLASPATTDFAALGRSLSSAFAPADDLARTARTEPIAAARVSNILMPGVPSSLPDPVAPTGVAEPAASSSDGVRLNLPGPPDVVGPSVPSRHAPIVSVPIVGDRSAPSAPAGEIGPATRPASAPVELPARLPSAPAAISSPSRLNAGSDQSGASTRSPENGGLFLDGAQVGRWMFDTLAEHAIRPQMGFTGLDPRLTPVFPGAPSGGANS